MVGGRLSGFPLSAVLSGGEQAGLQTFNLDRGCRRFLGRFRCRGWPGQSWNLVGYLSLRLAFI